MKKISGKKTIGFWISILSVIMGVVSLIAYKVVSTDGENTPPAVYGITAAAVMFTLITAFWNHRELGNRIYNTASFAAPVLYAVSCMVFLTGRMEWLGGLAAHNANFAPMHTSFYVVIGCFAAAMLMGIIASFMQQIVSDETA